MTSRLINFYFPCSVLLMLLQVLLGQKKLDAVLSTAGLCSDQKQSCITIIRNSGLEVAEKETPGNCCFVRRQERCILKKKTKHV